MILEEVVSESLVRHYSNQGKMIKQVETGICYKDATDVLPCRYTYKECDIATDVKITAEAALAELLEVLEQ